MARVAGARCSLGRVNALADLHPLKRRHWGRERIRIAFALRQAESGASAAAVIRKLGIARVRRCLRAA